MVANYVNDVKEDLESNDGPLLSVLMCCYNSSEFIGEALESIRNQSYKNFEIVIVDDCSTDNTFDIASKFCAKNNNFFCFRTLRNSGPAAARNLGLKHCRGEWISNLDSDDVAHRSRLELQVSYLAINPNVVLLGSGARYFNDSDRKGYDVQFSDSSDDLKKTLEFGGAFPPHSSIIYCTNAIKAVGGFDERMKRCQDYDLFLRLIKSGDFGCVSNSLVYVRKHDSNISEDNGGELSLTYSRIALVSHILRKEFSIDTKRYSNEEWDSYYNYIDETVTELDKRLKRIRQKRNSGTDSPMVRFRTLSILSILLTLTKARNLIVYGNSNSYKLITNIAQAWVDRQA